MVGIGRMVRASTHPTLLLIACVLGAVAAASVLGCAKKPASTVDAEPFKKAVAAYCQRNNMAMALKEIKSGPDLDGATATMTASMTHAEMTSGPSVTWTMTFEKDTAGGWKVAKHTAR